MINLSVVSQAPDVQVDALGEPVSGRVDSDALNNNKGIENQVVVRLVILTDHITYIVYIHTCLHTYMFVN